MASFKDCKGREWPIVITIGVVNRIKDKADLRYALDDKMKMFQEIVSDPCKLADTVFAILKPQADAAGVSLEDFADALDGDVIYAMASAFESALSDFFPPPMRGPLKKLSEKRRAYQESTANWAVKKMDAIDTAKEANQDAEAKLALGNTSPKQSTNGPGSLE